MNNRFNFRMWDINTKRFYYMYLDELIGLTRTISIPKEATIQQYTGLTDKNGKEIYEGDLIRGMFDFGPAGFSELMLPVCWHNIDGYQWNYWNLSTIEVVGNAFEQKELLKQYEQNN
jgi:hypothetical protein